MTGIETFYLCISVAIVMAIALSWAINADKSEQESMKSGEDSEMFFIREGVRDSVEFIAPQLSEMDKKTFIDHFSIEILHHGMRKYKEGFEMGQQLELSKTVEDLEPGVAEAIMKNQQKPVL